MGRQAHRSVVRFLLLVVSTASIVSAQQQQQSDAGPLLAPFSRPSCRACVYDRGFPSQSRVYCVTPLGAWCGDEWKGGDCGVYTLALDTYVDCFFQSERGELWLIFLLVAITLAALIRYGKMITDNVYPATSRPAPVLLWQGSRKPSARGSRADAPSESAPPTVLDQHDHTNGTDENDMSVHETMTA